MALIKCDECGKLTDRIYRCPCCWTGYCSECKKYIDTKRNNCKRCNNN